MIPTKSLYLGAAGEHHVMAECFRHYREAFKLPIDRGFDLVITNAYKHLSAAEVAATRETTSTPDAAPLYVQVKSRQGKLERPKQGGSDARPSWEGAFNIKISDLSLICDTPNAILACVLFIDTSDQLSMARTAYSWWLSSAKVRELREAGYFFETDNHAELALWVRYTQPSPSSTAKQNTYISLYRQSRSRLASPGDRASGELLERECFDFEKLPVT